MNWKPLLDPESRLKWLERLYGLHETYLQKLALHCREGCAVCCTRSVTATTLEARYIMNGLTDRGELHLLKRLEAASESERFRPRITINQLAEICMNGETPPDEPNDPGWGACPFLEANRCLIYPVRPFGCRLMVSTRNCAETGCADMPELILTINQVLQQSIEHADAGGLTGNLIDVLHLPADGKYSTYSDAQPLTPPTPNLLRNRPAPVLMVPPAHRRAVSKILNSLATP